MTAVKSANGVTGQLITSFDGTVYFRVYDADHNFKDYDLVHSDLTMTIDDVDAFFYEDEFNSLLDHAPATLGKNNGHKKQQ
jgi:hypothetical protein